LINFHTGFFFCEGKTGCEDHSYWDVNQIN
jgi:hypothetical protein